MSHREPNEAEIEIGAKAALEMVLPGMPWFYLPTAEKIKVCALVKTILTAVYQRGKSETLVKVMD